VDQYTKDPLCVCGAMHNLGKDIQGKKKLRKMYLMVDIQIQAKITNYNRCNLGCNAATTETKTKVRFFHSKLISR